MAVRPGTPNYGDQERCTIIILGIKIKNDELILFYNNNMELPLLVS